MADKDSSVIIHGNNSGIIITGNNNTIHIDKEKLLNRESVTNTFKSYYKNHFKTISLLIEDDKKPIDDIYVNLAIIKDEKEEDIKDKSKLLDRDKIINSYEEIYKPKEPIAIEELIKKSSKNNSSKALIYGKAGIGKTTFCKYIAYRWARGELYNEFENIVYIALREWKEDGLESVIKKIYFQEKYKDHVIEIDQSKTLFLFDGYDELSDTSVLHNTIKTYNLQNYIITSRPYGYRKSDFDVNEVFETIGFTDENVTAYIDKFFEEESHKTNLQNFLKQNINIRHIAYIPLMLEMICSLWREKDKKNKSFLSPMTMTELYKEVIEYIFFEYTETNNTSYIQEKEDEIFDYLGKIAFEGLKNQVIILDKMIIKENKKFFVDYVLKTGFLKSDRKHRNSLINSYEFSHLTFQEYFAALYVSKLPKEEISEIIRDYKFYPYMQVFFAFLGGVIKDKEFLLEEIMNEPRDLVGFYETLFILNLLAEINKYHLNEIRVLKIKELLTNMIKMCIEINMNCQYMKLKDLDDIRKDIALTVFIDFIKNENIDYLTRGIFSRYLSLNKQQDKKFINMLLELAKDEIFDLFIKLNIAFSLVACGRKDSIILNILNDFIKDASKPLFYRGIWSRRLIYVDFYNDITINTLIECMKDPAFEKGNYKQLDSLISLIQNKVIDSASKTELLDILRKTIYNTPRYANFTSRIEESFEEVFIRNSPIESLLNGKYINLNMIIENAMYNKLPLYLKNSKLHTIYENKEIKTQGEVSLKEVEKAKEELRLSIWGE
jgi:hypothetical protein